ncbi:MAG: YgfZ/GcvT domain-containing protein [Microcystaceae cyanobacterium]
MAIAPLSEVSQGLSFYAPVESSLLALNGEDRIRFLHNQTTNNLNSLKVGYHCLTVFVNSTGRTLDLATAYKQEDSLLIHLSGQRRQFLLNWMDRYIFPMDQVSLTDLSTEYAIFQLYGVAVGDYQKTCGLTLPEAHQQLTVSWLDMPMVLAAGNVLDLPGFTLIVPQTIRSQLQQKVIQDQFTAIAPATWEKWRIYQGRPVPDHELTEDYNPLEAGLWRAISFDKGCYIGQETIARLNTYQGVKQRLWGLQLDRAVNPNTPITLEGEKVGLLTSITEEEKPWGLGYIRTKAGGENLTVQIGEATGQVVAVPFLRHEYYQPQVSNPV